MMDEDGPEELGGLVATLVALVLLFFSLVYGLYMFVQFLDESGAV